MREQHADFKTGTHVFILASGAFLLIMATSVMGQGGPPFAPGSHPDPAKERMLEMQQREAALRGLAIPTRTPTDTRSVQAALVQIAQDYKQIQILRNEIVHTIETDKTLDYKHILSATAEIKKRASRLKTYIVTLKQDENEKKQKIEIGPDEKEMRSALITLCNQITSFVSNPVFTNPGVVDVKQSSR
ncbi:MAG: hypothetical protein WBP93_03345, partial [Pyrinomonadaceae bacterium]